MIGPTGAVRVMVATKPVDFRNYVERRIMRSPGPQDAMLKRIWREGYCNRPDGMNTVMQLGRKRGFPL